MHNKGYSFFESLYNDSADSVICIDKELNIVFATNSVYSIFGTDHKSFSHISYVLPMRYCYLLQDTVKESKTSAFISRNVVDGNEYKFTVIPYPVDDEPYFLISLSLVSAKSNPKQEEFIDLTLKIAEKELAQCTSSIVSACDEIDNNKRTRIISSIRRIRKLFDSFYTVMSKSSTDKEAGVIDLNRYFMFFIETVYRFIGYEKADIHLIPSSQSTCVRITQQALDIICCNAIAATVKNTLKSKATISIAVSRTQDGCLILFSDNEPGSHAADSENSLLSFALMEKLTRDYDGSFFVSDDSRLGTTIAISFPQSTVTDVLYSPEEFDTEGIFSTFAVMLSDI